MLLIYNRHLARLELVSYNGRFSINCEAECSELARFRPLQLLLQVNVAALVAGVLDVDTASPRRYFFRVLHHFASEPAERERLGYFASPEGRDDLARYNQREGMMLQRTSSSEIVVAWHAAVAVLLRSCVWVEFALEYSLLAVWLTLVPWICKVHCR